MTLLICDQTHNGYMCTLALNHDGPHAAFGGDDDIPFVSWGWTA